MGMILIDTEVTDQEVWGLVIVISDLYQGKFVYGVMEGTVNGTSDALRESSTEPLVEEED